MDAVDILKLFEKGLAYKSEIPINWCVDCKIGLANEEVVNGVCERCGGQVVRKVKSQWMLRITKYAERLLNDLDDLVLSIVLKPSKEMDRTLEGAEVNFRIKDSDEVIRVFTTRPDTLRGDIYGRFTGAPLDRKICFKDNEYRRFGSIESLQARSQISKGLSL